MSERMARAHLAYVGREVTRDTRTEAPALDAPSPRRTARRDAVLLARVEFAWRMARRAAALRSARRAQHHAALELQLRAEGLAEVLRLGTLERRSDRCAAHNARVVEVVESRRQSASADAVVLGSMQPSSSSWRRIGAPSALRGASSTSSSATTFAPRSPTRSPRSAICSSSATPRRARAARRT